MLIRHGQSEGNTDRVAYSKTPDSQIALTDRGWAQASVAGLQLRELVGDESVRFFYSPYTRARQTMLAMLQAFEGRPVEISQEPRLREQDFGNFQDPEAMEEVMQQRQARGRTCVAQPQAHATQPVPGHQGAVAFKLRPQCDHGAEGGADTHLAFDLQTTVHQFAQALGDCQAESAGRRAIAGR